MKVNYIFLIPIILFFSCEQDNSGLPDEDETNNDNSATFTDNRDGQTYNYVEIGNQVWMAENLNFNSVDSWAYGFSDSLAQIYGRLYLWETACSSCPDGWHLPSDQEWAQLEGHLGMSSEDFYKSGYRGSNEGYKLKSESGWSMEGNGSNIFGFNALPAGIAVANWDTIYSENDFNSLDLFTGFWSSTGGIDSSIVYRHLHSTYGQIGRGNNGRGFGFSIRCIQD